MPLSVSKIYNVEIRLLRPLALVLLALTSSNVSAEAPINGRVYSNVYIPTRSPFSSELQQTDIGFWLQGSPRISPESSAHFTLSGDSRSYSKTRRESYTTSGETLTTNFATDLREAYARYNKDSVELRVGKQIIPWGKSDGINPTDVISAKDLTYFQPDDEMRRLGALSTQFFFTPNAGASAWNFNLVWTPIFPQSKLLIPKKSIPAGVIVQPAQQSRITLRDTEIAGKVSYTGDGWDFSVMSFKGWNHQSEFKEQSRTVSLTGASVTVAPVFSSLRAYGADLSVSGLGAVWRLEGAYKYTDNHSGKDAVTIPNYVDLVAGVEKKIFDDYRVQLQGILRRLQRQPAVITDQITDSIAKTNQLILGYQDMNRHGASFRIGYENDDSLWKMEFFILGYAGGDYYYRPKITYLWSGAFETSLGADHYGGNKDKPLGSLYEFNAAFLDTRYFF